MRNIKLSNGNVYQVDRCGADATTLMVNVVHEGYHLLDLVEVFGYPENVQTIEHYFDGTTTDHRFFEGYTKLTNASTSQTGTLLILQKGSG